MKIKTATLWGMVGAIVSIILNVFYFSINAFQLDWWSPALGICTNLLNLFSSVTLVLFFYTLYINQK